MRRQWRLPEGPWWTVGLLLVLTPLGMAGIASIGRHHAARTQTERLEHVASMIAGREPDTSEPVAVRENVIVAHIDTQGATISRTRPVRVANDALGLMLQDADSRLPPWPERQEVQAALDGHRTFARYWALDGSVLLQTLAQPLPTNGALYILTASRMSDFQKPLAIALKTAIGEIALILWLLAMGVHWRSRRGKRDAQPGEAPETEVPRSTGAGAVAEVPVAEVPETSHRE